MSFDFGAMASGGFGALLDYASNQQSNKQSSDNTARTNETNIRLAQENRDFQERMRNTAVQSYADDAEKAGFNRLIALGQSASTPSGSVASVSSPSYTSPLSGVGDKLSSAYKLASLDSLLKQADLAQKVSATKVNQATVNNIAQTTANAKEQNKVIKAQAVQEDAKAEGAKTDKLVEQSTLGKVMHYVTAPLKALGSVLGSASSFSRMF